jgi:hypothetical protein
VDVFRLTATRDVVRAAIAAAVGAELQNVTVIQVTDARQLHGRPVLYQMVAGSGGGGGGGARRLPAGTAVAIRATASLSDPSSTLSALRGNSTDLETALVAALAAASPSIFGACTVAVTDLLVPPVVPRTSVVVVREASGDGTFLGLPVWAWIAIGAGAGVIVIVGAIVGFVCGRRRAPLPAKAPAPEPPQTRRGKLRRMNSLLAGVPATVTRGLNNAAGKEGGATGDEGDEEGDDVERGLKTKAKAGKRSSKEEDDNDDDGDDAATSGTDDGMVVNPMVRAGRARPSFAVASGVLAEPKIPMEPPLPIERVVFDFPITATTNPYHLMFLGDPNARESIDAAIARATALAARLTSNLDKVESDMATRRANLVRGGILQAKPIDEGGLPTSRLVELVAKHEETHPSDGLRATEVNALRGGEEDAALLKLRRAKYVELAEDLRRLRGLLDRGTGPGAGAAAREARAGKRDQFGLAAFAPTTRVSLGADSGPRAVGGRDGEGVRSASGRVLVTGRGAAKGK